MSLSTKAKMLTASLAGILLSIGLCAVGGGFDTHVAQWQIIITYLGGFVFLVSLVLLVSGLSRSEK